MKGLRKQNDTHNHTDNAWDCNYHRGPERDHKWSQLPDGHCYGGSGSNNPSCSSNCCCAHLRHWLSLSVTQCSWGRGHGLEKVLLHGLANQPIREHLLCCPDLTGQL